MLKAYLIVDKYYSNEEQVIVFAETQGKAKVKGLESGSFYDYHFTELKAERKKEFDRYSDTQKIPIKELLDQSWWFCCKYCSKDHLDEDSIQEGEAFVSDETMDDDFVQGSIICKDCHKKINGGSNGI